MSHLRFTPYAWSKLVYMRDIGNTEVAGYGISSIDDPFLVKDFMLVKQQSCSVSFEFDDEGFADYVDDMLDLDLQPAEFQRILIHTHPGNSANPSGVDEKNFEEKFSDCDWAIMFILANGGETTCALKYKYPECRVILNNSVDFNEEFGESRHEEWEEEYDRCVSKKVYPRTYKKRGKKKTTSKKITPKKVKNPDSTVKDDAYYDSRAGWMDFEEEEEDMIDVFNRGGMY